MSVIDVHNDAQDVVREDPMQGVSIVLDGVIEVQLKEIMFYVQGCSHDGFRIPASFADMEPRVLHITFDQIFILEHFKCMLHVFRRE